MDTHQLTQLHDLASGATEHRLERFPVALAILLHYITLGIFSLFHLNMMHGKLPKVRRDDPSAGRAIGFMFIPFYNFYWVFFSYNRLCLRVDEQRTQRGLQPSNLRGLSIAMCVTMLIPYVGLFVCWPIIAPIFFGLIRSSVNELISTEAPSVAPRPLRGNGQRPTPTSAQTKDQGPDVRKAAPKRIADQRVLANTAKNDKDSAVRWTASEVERLTDQNLLADIAKNDKVLEVRWTALKGMTDQRLLADIAKNDKEWEVRRVAAGRLTDQSVLADIAKNDKVLDVRDAAVMHLTDQSLLADIAKNLDDLWSLVRDVAVRRVTDQSLLADIATNAKDTGVRQAAAKLVTDQRLLADIATKQGQAANAKVALTAKAAIAPTAEATGSILGSLASSLVAGATSSVALAPGQFRVVVEGTLNDASMTVKMQSILGASASNVLHLAVMCFDLRGEDVLRGKDKDETWWDLDDVKQPAVLYVPRETLPYLQRQSRLWRRVQGES